MTTFASIKHAAPEAGKASKSNTSTRTRNSNLCSTARNFTSMQSLMWWIHIGYINIPYLGPVKTLDGINAFSLKHRDVLLTLSHSHLNQRIEVAIDDGWFLWLEPSLERLQRLRSRHTAVCMEKGKETPQKRGGDEQPWFTESATKREFI